MDRKIAGLLGAAAALTTIHAAQAAPAQVPRLAPAASYRDLLEPIPNALIVLKADDARSAGSATQQQPVQLAQYYHHHHHHHHHHHGYVRVIPPRFFRRHYHHHHHHHHHHHGFGVYIR